MFQETETIKSFLYFRRELPSARKIEKPTPKKCLIYQEWKFLAQSLKSLYVNIEHKKPENQKSHIFGVL